jgi:hypothetical protein
MATMSTESNPPSLQRLTRLVAHRAGRKAEQHGAPLTPIPSLVETVGSSLRRKQRAAQIIDDVVAQARSAASSTVPPGRQSALSDAPWRAHNQTPDPYVRYKKTPTPHVPVFVEGRQEDLWATMAKQAALEGKVAEVSAKLARAQKMQAQKQILDDQVSLRQHRATDRIRELVEDRQVIEKNASEWTAEQRNAAAERRRVALQVKSDRERQVAARMTRREVFEAERREQEAAILDRIQLELQAERIRAAAIRDREIAFKEDLINANEQQRRIKEERAAREADEDASYVRLYDERLERQSNARAVAWEAMKKKMQGKEAIAFNLAATLAEKAVEDERRAAIVTKQREDAQAARLDDEVRQRKDATLLVRDCQVEQIALKRTREEVMRDSVYSELDDVKRTTLREMEDARRERQQRRELQRQQRKWLAEQMYVKNHQRDVVMSEEERRLNAALLDRSITRDWTRTTSP